MYCTLVWYFDGKRLDEKGVGRSRWEKRKKVFESGQVTEIRWTEDSRWGYVLQTKLSLMTWPGMNSGCDVVTHVVPRLEKSP